MGASFLEMLTGRPELCLSVFLHGEKWRRVANNSKRATFIQKIANVYILHTASCGFSWSSSQSVHYSLLAVRFTTSHPFQLPTPFTVSKELWESVQLHSRYQMRERPMDSPGAW